jgi:predicted nucleic acid-binding protein
MFAEQAAANLGEQLRVTVVGRDAADAIAHGAAICTQDSDFDAVAEAGLLEVVRV